MTKDDQYAVLGFRALQRAARKVAEDAIKNNYKIPIWKNGRIVYEIPEVPVVHPGEAGTENGDP